MFTSGGSVTTLIESLIAAFASSVAPAVALDYPREETVRISDDYSFGGWGGFIPVRDDGFWGTYLMYEPMFGTNVATGELFGWLGENIKWVDNLTIEVTLRENIYWKGWPHEENWPFLPCSPLPGAGQNANVPMILWSIEPATAPTTTTTTTISPTTTTTSSTTTTTTTTPTPTTTAAPADTTWIWVGVIVAAVIVIAVVALVLKGREK